MVKYTRRHFQEIAALISKVPAAQRREEAERYANMFRADNPRFDKGKFMAACKLDAENVGSCGCKGKGKKKAPKRVGNMEAGRQSQWDKFKASGRIEQYPAMYKKLQTASDTQLKNLRGFAKSLSPEDLQYHKSYDSYLAWNAGHMNKVAMSKSDWQDSRIKNLKAGYKGYVAKQT
jgi:hypothetical protein